MAQMATMNTTNIALLAGASLVLAVFGGVMSKHVVDLRAHTRRRQELPLPEPVELPSVDFFYYPGEPSGYAGFTDYHAMSQSITDDLVAREFDWQFKTAGFAAGFLNAVWARTRSAENAPHVFRVTGATADDVEAIRWMVTRQQEGTDNASPSTSNLRSMVLKVASDMATNGPCRVKYWSKADEDENQGLAEAGISAERLLEYKRLMQLAEQRGELLGARAQIMPVDAGAA